MHKHKLYGLRASLAAAALALLGAQAARADFAVAGDYVIHYNALNTQVLQPEVARQYEIVRSKNRALLNIAVRKKAAPDALQDTAATAEVKASAVNLTGQLKEIEMREVHEGEAIYYLGVFPVNNEETLNFTLEVDPEKQGKPHTIKFRQQFFE